MAKSYSELKRDLDEVLSASRVNNPIDSPFEYKEDNIYWEGKDITIRDPRYFDSIGHKYNLTDVAKGLDLEQKSADQQSGWEIAGRTVVNFGLQTAGGFLQSLASNDPRMLINQFTDQGNLANEETKNWLYKLGEDLLNKQRIVYNNKYGISDDISNIVSSAGYSVGILGESLATSAILAGIGVGIGGSLAKLGMSTSKAFKALKNTGNLITRGGIMAGVKEAAINSQSVRDEVYQNFKNLGYSDQEATKIANSSATENMYKELLPSVGLNMLVFGKFFGKSFGKLDKNINVFDKNVRDSATKTFTLGYSNFLEKVIPENMLNKLGKFGKTGGVIEEIGKGALVESIEEGVQTAIQQKVVNNAYVENGEYSDYSFFNKELGMAVAGGAFGGAFLPALGKGFNVGMEKITGKNKKIRQAYEDGIKKAGRSYAEDIADLQEKSETLKGLDKKYKSTGSLSLEEQKLAETIKLDLNRKANRSPVANSLYYLHLDAVNGEGNTDTFNNYVNSIQNAGNVAKKVKDEMDSYKIRKEKQEEGIDDIDPISKDTFDEALDYGLIDRDGNEIATGIIDNLNRNSDEILKKAQKTKEFYENNLRETNNLEIAFEKTMWDMEKDYLENTLKKVDELKNTILTSEEYNRLPEDKKENINKMFSEDPKERINFLEELPRDFVNFLKTDDNSVYNIILAKESYLKDQIKNTNKILNQFKTEKGREQYVKDYLKKEIQNFNLTNEELEENIKKYGILSEESKQELREENEKSNEKKEIDKIVKEELKIKSEPVISEEKLEEVEKEMRKDNIDGEDTSKNLDLKNELVEEVIPKFNFIFDSSSEDHNLNKESILNTLNSFFKVIDANTLTKKYAEETYNTYLGLISDKDKGNLPLEKIINKIANENSSFKSKLNIIGYAIVGSNLKEEDRNYYSKYALEKLTDSAYQRRMRREDSTENLEREYESQEVSKKNDLILNKEIQEGIYTEKSNNYTPIGYGKEMYRINLPAYNIYSDNLDNVAVLDYNILYDYRYKDTLPIKSISRKKLDVNVEDIEIVLDSEMRKKLNKTKITIDELLDLENQSSEKDGKKITAYLNTFKSGPLIAIPYFNKKENKVKYELNRLYNPLVLTEIKNSKGFVNNSSLNEEDNKRLRASLLLLFKDRIADLREDSERFNIDKFLEKNKEYIDILDNSDSLKTSDLKNKEKVLDTIKSITRVVESSDLFREYSSNNKILDINKISFRKNIKLLYHYAGNITVLNSNKEYRIDIDKKGNYVLTGERVKGEESFKDYSPTIPMYSLTKEDNKSFFYKNNFKDLLNEDFDNIIDTSPTHYNTDNLNNKIIDPLHYINQSYPEVINYNEYITKRYFTDSKVINLTSKNDQESVKEIPEIKEVKPKVKKEKDNILNQNNIDKELYNKIKEKLQEKYPEIKLNISNNPIWEIENDYIYNQEKDLKNIMLQKNEVNRIIGQANIKAMTILIDAVNQKQDTLPHEYAHHYIAWFKDTDIVKEGIKRFGSEELLVDAIGKQVVEQKGEALDWWKKFTKWVIELFSDQDILNILTDSFLNRVDLKKNFQTFTPIESIENTPILIEKKQIKNTFDTLLKENDEIDKIIRYKENPTYEEILDKIKNNEKIDFKHKLDFNKHLKNQIYFKIDQNYSFNIESNELLKEIKDNFLFEIEGLQYEYNELNNFLEDSLNNNLIDKNTFLNYKLKLEYKLNQLKLIDSNKEYFINKNFKELSKELGTKIKDVSKIEESIIEEENKDNENGEKNYSITSANENYSQKLSPRLKIVLSLIEDYDNISNKKRDSFGNIVYKNRNSVIKELMLDVMNSNGDEKKLFENIKNKKNSLSEDNTNKIYYDSLIKKLEDLKSKKEDTFKEILYKLNLSKFKMIGAYQINNRVYIEEINGLNDIYNNYISGIYSSKLYNNIIKDKENLEKIQKIVKNKESMVDSVNKLLKDLNLDLPYNIIVKEEKNIKEFLKKIFNNIKYSIDNNIKVDPFRENKKNIVNILSKFNNADKIVTAQGKNYYPYVKPSFLAKEINKINNDKNNIYKKLYPYNNLINNEIDLFYAGPELFNKSDYLNLSFKEKIDFIVNLNNKFIDEIKKEEIENLEEDRYGNKIVDIYNLMVFPSDKTTLPIIKVKGIFLKNYTNLERINTEINTIEYNGLKQRFLDSFVRSDINNMLSTRYLKDTITNKHIKNNPLNKLFTKFPSLNSLIITTSDNNKSLFIKVLNEIIEKGIEKKLSKEELSNTINDFIKKHDNEISIHIAETLLKRVDSKNNLNIDFIINDYLTKADFQDVLGNINSFGKGVIINDKNGKTKKINDIKDLTTDNLSNINIETYKKLYDNYYKRLAGTIAPANLIADSTNDKYIQITAEDSIIKSEIVENLIKSSNNFKNSSKEKQKQILDALNTFLNSENENEKKLAEDILEETSYLPYLKINSTDAQEYTTWKEHVDILYRKGNIDDETKKRIEGRLSKQEELGESDLKLMLNPLKGVYYGKRPVYNNKNEVEYLDTVYIKSSSFPLLPQFKGLAIDKLRQSMEKLQKEKGMNVRFSYASGNKLGHVSSNLKFEDTLNDNFKLSEDNYIVLDRSGYGIQQENEVKTKNKVIESIQLRKMLLSNGIKQIKNKVFTLSNNTLTKLSKLGILNTNDIKDFKISGEKLSEIFEKLEKDISAENYQELVKEIGLYSESGVDKFAENLRNWNIEKDWNIEDSYFDTVFDENTGKFKFKTSLTNLPERDYQKIESFLSSLGNTSLLKNKLPGQSLTLGSSEGFKLLSEKEISNIVYINKDSNTGQLTTKVLQNNSKIAQILISPKFTDTKTGKRINLFSDEYSEIVDNKRVLKQGKVGDELLKTLSFRIPFSDLQSGIRVEVIGFLPSTVGDLIISAPESVVQLGEDFDIDKRYLYNYNYVINKNGDILKKPLTINTESLEKADMENILVEIYDSVYSTEDSNVQESINKALSTQLEEDAIKELDNKNINNIYNNSILDPIVQEYYSKIGSEGKALVGGSSAFITSLAVLQKSNEILEGVKLNPSEIIKIDEDTYDSIIGIKSKSGRSINNQLGILQNEALDAAKLFTLDIKNLNKYNATLYMTLVSLGVDTKTHSNGKTYHLPTLIFGAKIVDNINSSKISKILNIDISSPLTIDELLFINNLENKKDILNKLGNISKKNVKNFYSTLSEEEKEVLKINLKLNYLKENLRKIDKKYYKDLRAYLGFNNTSYSLIENLIKKQYNFNKKYKNNFSEVINNLEKSSEVFSMKRYSNYLEEISSQFLNDFNIKEFENMDKYRIKKFIDSYIENINEISDSKIELDLKDISSYSSNISKVKKISKLFFNNNMKDYSEYIKKRGFLKEDYILKYKRISYLKDNLFIKNLNQIKHGTNYFMKINSNEEDINNSENLKLAFMELANDNLTVIGKKQDGSDLTPSDIAKELLIYSSSFNTKKGLLNIYSFIPYEYLNNTGLLNETNKNNLREVLDTMVNSINNDNLVDFLSIYENKYSLIENNEFIDENNNILRPENDVDNNIENIVNEEVITNPDESTNKILENDNNEIIENTEKNNIVIDKNTEENNINKGIIRNIFLFYDKNINHSNFWEILNQWLNYSDIRIKFENTNTASFKRDTNEIIFPESIKNNVDSAKIGPQLINIVKEELLHSMFETFLDVNKVKEILSKELDSQGNILYNTESLDLNNYQDVFLNDMINLRQIVLNKINNKDIKVTKELKYYTKNIEEFLTGIMVSKDLQDIVIQKDETLLMRFINLLKNIFSQFDTTKFTIGELQTEVFDFLSKLSNEYKNNKLDNFNIIKDNSINKEKLFNSKDKILKKGSVVKYNNNLYLYWNTNTDNKTQLINIDGTKFSDTPLENKLEVLGSYPKIKYNSDEYIVTDNNNIYSATTGKLVYTKDSNSNSVKNIRNLILNQAKNNFNNNLNSFYKVPQEILDVLEVNELNLNSSEIDTKSDLENYISTDKFSNINLDNFDSSDSLEMSILQSLIEENCK